MQGRCYPLLERVGEDGFPINDVGNDRKEVILGINAKKCWFLSWTELDIPLQIGSPMGAHESARLPILVFQPSERPF